MSASKWFGLTCAACHTGAIVPKADSGARLPGTIIVDGAPSSADIGGFFLSLSNAVQATFDSQIRLDAFAQRVKSFEPGNSIPNVELSFKTYAKQMQNVFPLYIPQNPSGPGRLDCFGAIFNRVGYDI